MKKSILFFLLLFSSSNYFSQLKQKMEAANLSFAIRGKYFTMFVFEDLYFRTYCYGAELIHKNKHSIGLDVNVFRWKSEEDDSKDVAKYQFFEKRASLLIDYKFNFLTNNSAAEFGIFYYINLFNKFNGKYTSWYTKEDYPFDSNYNTNFLKSTATGTFNEPGVGIGIKNHFDYDFHGFGIDASFNITKRFSTIYEQNFDINNQINYNTVHEEKLRFYIRLNLFYHFFRNN